MAGDTHSFRNIIIMAMRLTLTASAAVLSAFVATSASAQNVFGNFDNAADRNEDLVDAIEDDAERDLDRFGNEGRQDGFSGTFALRGIASTGNTDSKDIGIGTDMVYVDGPNGYELQLSYVYGEDDGAKTEESLYYGLEYTRDITPRLFGFAKVQGSIDEFSTIDSDTFVSFGAGYRVYNTADLQWSLQAGPGYRFGSFRDVADGDYDEVAFGVASDYSHKLSETVYITNDTDLITSDSNTVVFNDLAVSVLLSDQLALRTSLLTEWNSDPAVGLDSTDNSVGVSLVYSFN
jgi:putative salt-induced outer membrane protein